MLLIHIPSLIFAIIAATLLIFFFIYLPYINGKQLEIADMIPIKDGDDAENLCEQFHFPAWEQLTQEQIFHIETRHTSFTHYCPVCDRYRNP
jgi:hypothetical protein